MVATPPIARGDDRPQPVGGLEPVGQTLVTSDGVRLAATWYPGREAPVKSLIAMPALAAPQRYLKHPARWLQERGWGVLTFDYRGIGGSEPRGRHGAGVRLLDWATKDMTAAIDWVRREVRPRFLAGLGHSLGGQILPFCPAHRHFDALVHVSVQSGDIRFWQGRDKVLLAIVYYLYPAVARALGYLPGRRLGLGTSIPGDVFLQWCRWGREGVYTDESGASLEHLYASVTEPILCFSFEDDRRYAPRPAVIHLHRQFTNATVEYRHVRPSDYGLAHIGHFGFFKPECGEALWEEMTTWLDARNLALAATR
jgi:predicted alpha/beta hydrolase